MFTNSNAFKKMMMTALLGSLVLLSTGCGSGSPTDKKGKTTATDKKSTVPKTVDPDEDTDDAADPAPPKDKGKTGKKAASPAKIEPKAADPGSPAPLPKGKAEPKPVPKLTKGDTLSVSAVAGDKDVGGEWEVTKVTPLRGGSFQLEGTYKHEASPTDKSSGRFVAKLTSDGELTATLTQLNPAGFSFTTALSWQPQKNRWGGTWTNGTTEGLYRLSVDE